MSRTIAAIGIDVDPTFPVFVASALECNVPVTTLNLRAAVDGEWRIPTHGEETATFWFGDHIVELHLDNAYFCRIIDMSSQQTDPSQSRRWIALTRALDMWLNQVTGRVVNRSRAATHNASKPLHEALLGRLGFKVPPSITSCDVAELRRFVRAGPAISKAISGVRAQTTMMTEELLDAFDPTGGPIHLQRCVDGDDARIHVVGDKLVAQRVGPGDGVDYRHDGRFSDLEVFDPPAALADALVKGSAAIGLHFAGWDFRIDADGEYWCLEANPMPGYSPYDARCEGAISRLLLEYLGEATIQ